MSTYEVDIIILSYAKSDDLKKLTIESIDSLIRSEDPACVKFNVLVIESNKDIAPYQYENSETIYPSESFGFHRYLNIGIRTTDSPFVCLCNNDLIFEKNWATEILKEMEKDPLLLSASPYCPRFHMDRGFEKYQSPITGYNNGILVGWCIFVNRDIFEIIGNLDEKFEFWYCDNDYSETLQLFKIKHCLISSSFVTHLSNESLKILDSKTKTQLTSFQYLYYDYKWNHKSKIILMLKTSIFNVRNFCIRVSSLFQSSKEN